MAKPSEGKKYECIQDVTTTVEGVQTFSYRKGEVYTSEKRGCITDAKGNKAHMWSDEREDELGIPFNYTFSTTFKEVN